MAIRSMRSSFERRRVLRAGALFGAALSFLPFLACSSAAPSRSSGEGGGMDLLASSSTATASGAGGGTTLGTGDTSASSGTSSSASSSSSSGGGGGPALAALDATVTAKMAAAHVPGLSTCVVKEAKVAFCRAYGLADIDAQQPVSSDTVFLIASISKTVTATVAMQLWEQSAFQLDDDVENYLSFSAHHPSSSEPFTFRRLMTHTSSVRDDWDTLDELYDTSGGDPSISLYHAMKGYFDPSGVYYDATNNFVPSPPGTTYEYSNEGIALIGYLAEAITGTAFADLAKENVLAPLAMNRSSFRISDFQPGDIAMPYGWSGAAFTAYGHYTFADYPDGGLFTTAPDLSRFLAAISGGGALDGQRILQSSTIAQMTSVQFPSIAPQQGIVFQHVDIDGDDWIGHSGAESGVATDMYYRASDGLGFVVLMNGDWPADPTPVYDLEDALIAYSASLP